MQRSVINSRRYRFIPMVFSGLLLFATFLLPISCAPDQFTRSYELGAFKVLAVVADRPEVNAGESVSITVYASDLLAGGRSITLTAQACKDPGVGFGVLPSCERDPARVTLAERVAVSGLTAPRFTGALSPSLTVVTPQAPSLFTNVPLEKQFNGVDYLVTLEFFDGDTLLEKTFKRILVSTRPTKHSNPSFEPRSVQTGNTPLTAPEADTEFFVQASAASAQAYDFYIDTTLSTQTERLLVQWYVSQGTLTLSSTDPGEPNTWQPPEETSSLPLFLVAVLRDGRGGVDILLP